MNFYLKKLYLKLFVHCTLSKLDFSKARLQKLSLFSPALIAKSSFKARSKAQMTIATQWLLLVSYTEDIEAELWYKIHNEDMVIAEAAFSDY